MWAGLFVLTVHCWMMTRKQTMFNFGVFLSIAMVLYYTLHASRESSFRRLIFTAVLLLYVAFLSNVGLYLDGLSDAEIMVLYRTLNVL